ncbi:MAG: YgaP family membrane protein, partial [Candidatus Binatia bacterium]
MPLTAQPFAESKELDAVRADLSVNVPQPERIGSIAAGAGLLLYGASRKSLGGALIALLGGALIHRGATGHCPLYENI